MTALTEPAPRTVTTGAQQRLGTRFLMSCAAIGAVTGVILLPANFVAAAVSTAMPLLYAPISGVWLVGPVLAMALLRRPGAAVITMLVAGIINIPTPAGPAAIVTCLMIGVAIEIGFVVTLYRVWGRWLYFATVLVFELLYAWTAYEPLSIDEMSPVVRVVFVVLLLASAMACTALGLGLAQRVESTGVARGISSSRMRSTKARSAPVKRVSAPVARPAVAPTTPTTVVPAPPAPPAPDVVRRPARPVVDGQDAVVRAVDLVKTYRGPEGTVAALDGTSFEAHHGRLTVITGPSGSGKSTLLQVLAGLDRPDSGVVEVGGLDIARLGDRKAAAFRRRRLGFVFQSFNLIGSLTARENILFPAEIDGRTVDPRRLDELADRLGIRDRLDHLPAQLSGGQQQRVAVARALLSNPDVIFADEPTGALDPRTASDLVELLQGLVDEGFAVVVVTHDPMVARQADDLWSMDSGVLTLTGPLQPADS